MRVLPAGLVVTRTAAITGASSRFSVAVRQLLAFGSLRSNPHPGLCRRRQRRLVDGQPCSTGYEEDSRAEVDMNRVMTAAAGSSRSRPTRGAHSLPTISSWRRLLAWLARASAA